ncbi:serine threonine-phosphatase 6 regulatory subunit 3-like isoform X1 [Micractinium conductrix]|uniref:Serine threonine-phosphatase 6 regulatory subunit 3-like isoform X1 n=1 Tax=Micractinium conductrix TaxID=554055 RepID=A0A2P6VGM8_9CHLO|nr:serine threonine-phosphatase 6 regulatory subunit 3-like isoform X1 [Micractinium conductrix]|eukprot:PSC73252.1 serine threonine-phosphatase 6 regulatory subunit 3-like isoform X1 [Micractinium conductrix]
MFWRVSGLNTASPVDSILDKEAYSLEELLDEDELIQECKSLNARLTAFLKQRETVEKLVRYLVEPPPEGADPKRSFKYPFTACEIFCCEVEGIFNTLLEDEALLARLFSLLQAPRPLNCMLAGYFSRVMGSLLLRRTQDIMQYLQKHQELLGQLVDHVDTTSIAEVLVRLVGADEQRAFLSTNHLQWLSETNLLYLLLDKLQPGQPVEAQSNAAEILAALAQSQVSPLTRNLAEPAFLELLVERALRQPDGDGAAAEGSAAADPAAAAPEAAANGNSGGSGSEDGAAAAKGFDAAAAKGDAGAPEAAAARGGEFRGSSGSSAMMHALAVCIALVEPLPPSPAEQQAAAQGLGLGAMPTPAVDAAAAELHATMRAQATQCIGRSIHRLVALLEAAEPDQALPTSYGLLHPPCGLARLKAVELVAALLHSGDEAAESAVMGTHGVQRCLELFLQFPFNNVLHRRVGNLVSAVDKGSPALAEFLLRDCALLGWLVDAPLEVVPAPRPGDARSAEQRKPLRAGYAGHVTAMSNRLIQLANDGQQQLQAAMEGDQRWQQYVRERLEPRNAQENVYAWKCGRPTVHEPVVESEADLFQTDLDFGSMDSEAFTRDVYQRYGVFTSHEDEEVDSEQPQWAMELMSAASAAGAVAPGPGKLPMPTSGGPQPFPVYDSSSSSSSEEDSDEEHALGSANSSSDAEVSVTPAPMPDSDVLLVDSGSSGGGDGSCAAAAAAGSVPARPPLGSDDADMEADAVMLEQEDVVLQEYDTAEQLISLAQLSLEDPAEGAAGAAQPAAGEQPAADEQSSGSGEAAEAEAEAAPQGEAGGGPPAVAPTSA